MIKKTTPKPVIIDKVKQLLELPTSILQEFVENPSKRLTNKDGDKYYYRYVKKIIIIF